MPDEALIKEFENILAEIVELGGQSENTKIVPNMLVTNDSPGGLTGFVTIQDDRDGDNILAKTVPGIIYATNDLVNVIFPKGGEAIAFQQGSQSASSSLWATVPATSTDIFYNQGDVGIGKAVAPDAALEILSASQAQLRLTFQEDTKFADLTVDTNHDLTIKPSSTGQIILQPTTDQTNSVQILDADGGTPVFNADLVNERIGIGVSAPDVILDIQKLDLTGSDAGIPQIRVTNTSSTQGDSSSTFNFANFQAFAGDGTVKAFFGARYNTGTFDNSAYIEADASSPITFKISTDRMRLDTSGQLGIGTNSPSTRLDIAAGAIEKEEMTAPGAGAANTTRQYAEDDASTTREQIIFNGGHVVTIARDGGLQTYTPTNVVADRSYDANATSVAELADVLGTLIADFQAAGVLG